MERGNSNVTFVTQFSGRLNVKTYLEAVHEFKFNIFSKVLRRNTRKKCKACDSKFNDTFCKTHFEMKKPFKFEVCNRGFSFHSQLKIFEQKKAYLQNDCK